MFLQDVDLRKTVDESARIQRAYCHYFDLTIINDNLDKAFETLQAAVDKLCSEPQWVPVNWVYWGLAPLVTLSSLRGPQWPTNMYACMCACACDHKGQRRRRAEILLQVINEISSLFLLSGLQLFSTRNSKGKSAYLFYNFLWKIFLFSVGLRWEWNKPTMKKKKESRVTCSGHTFLH